MMGEFLLLRLISSFSYGTVDSSIVQYFPSYPFKKALAALLTQFIFDTKIRQFTYLSTYCKKTQAKYDD